MQIGFLVRCAPYSYENLDTAYFLSRAALDGGHGVDVYLYEDAVLAAHGAIRSGSERNVATRLQELVAHGAAVFLCGTCARFRGLRRADVVDGARVTGLTGLAAMIERCDRLVTLGT